MTKKPAWPPRAMYALVATALIISLMITAAPPPAEAAPGGTVRAEWERIDTPSMEDWVLAPESEIIDFATAAPGEVAYAVVRAEMRPDHRLEDWHPWYLLRSTDHAATWRDITLRVDKELDRKDLGEIAWMSHVACAPDDTDFLAVTVWPTGSTGVHVLVSKDGGTTFRDSGIVEHSCVALAEVFAFVASPQVGGERELAIAGIGSDGFGAVFRSRAIGDWSTGWEIARYQGWDGTDDPVVPASTAVFDVKFAPSWAADRTILAVTGTPSPGGFDIHLQSGTWGTTEGWNARSTPGIAPVLVKGDVILPDLASWIAGMALPSDYAGHTAGQRYSWVWINYWDPTDTDNGPATGEIFRVANTYVINVTQQIHGRPWLTNVSYWGTIASGKAIAGRMGAGTSVSSPAYPDAPFTSPCQGVQVYRYLDVLNMDICCPAWQAACKPPTGNAVMEAFYVKEDKAYAVAMGPGAYNESAWSWSFDEGETWNQLSLIDTHIDFLSDVAVSPDCNKTMLVSINRAEGWDRYWLCDSVWYHAKDLAHYGFDEYNGKWQRTWSGQFGDEQYGMLRLNPDEDDGRTVYLVDRGTNTIYYNDMQTLACWSTRVSTIDEIADLVVKNQRTIYAIDLNGDVAMSDNYGRFVSWTDPKDSQLYDGWTIAVWGDEVLVGGQDGDVSHSVDGGHTFTELEDVAASGLVTVVFDIYFGDNNTIYAALAGAGTDNGVYRWVVGESMRWTNLGAQPYDYTGLVLDRFLSTADKGGVLYASYVSETGGHVDTGVARCLTPAEPLCCDEADWDYLVDGLTSSEAFTRMPRALKICGPTPLGDSKLFAIDGSQYDMDKGRDGTVWSYVAAYSDMLLDEPVPEEGLESISDHLLIVYIWRPATQSWDMYWPQAGIDTIATLEAGSAYWVLVDADCTLEYGTRSFELYAGWNNIAWLPQVRF